MKEVLVGLAVIGIFLAYCSVWAWTNRVHDEYDRPLWARVCAGSWLGIHVAAIVLLFAGALGHLILHT